MYYVGLLDAIRLGGFDECMISDKYSLVSWCDGLVQWSLGEGEKHFVFLYPSEAALLVARNHGLHRKIVRVAFRRFQALTGAKANLGVVRREPTLKVRRTSRLSEVSCGRGCSGYPAW
jgi:hypothetical protein